MRYLLFIFGLSIILIACKEQTEPNFHKEYYGLEHGRYVIYDVVQIFHDEDVNQHDTSIYQLKALWRDPYIDNEGREATEYVRFTRASSSDDWQVADVWYGIIDGIRAELVEENQRKVKLVFAPTYQKEWDENAYNISGERLCFYRDIHSDTILNGTVLDSTLVVVQDNPLPSLIDTVYAYEMYSKHIGMVYKHLSDRHFDIGNPIVQYGTELYMTYNSHGVE